MDKKDQALLAALKRDGRASVTQLAAELELSRTTVQNRIDRLQRSGVIRRFTVELASADRPAPVAAITMIELEGAVKRSVVRALSKLPELASLHSTNGAWDLVARIETDSLPRFDNVLNQIRAIPGVRRSETCLLLDEARA